MRIHPAIIAQAAATSAVLSEGRFPLGVGSGEALNEHILGDRWPAADVRLEMLEEAVEVIRELWKGERVSHRGKHYTVENARIYTLPDAPPPIYVSGVRAEGGRAGGAHRRRLRDHAARTRTCRSRTGQRGRQGPAMAGAKVCWGADRDERAEDRRTSCGPTRACPASSRRSCRARRTSSRPRSWSPRRCRRDVRRAARTPTTHVETIDEYADAGYDELYVAQIGPAQDEFFRVYESEVLPALRGATR